jgi:hypothetical protein
MAHSDHVNAEGGTPTEGKIFSQTNPCRQALANDKIVQQPRDSRSYVGKSAGIFYFNCQKFFTKQSLLFGHCQWILIVKEVATYLYTIKLQNKSKSISIHY